jgi:hypothetical protein
VLNNSNYLTITKVDTYLLQNSFMERCRISNKMLVVDIVLLLNRGFDPLSVFRRAVANIRSVVADGQNLVNE